MKKKFSRFWMITFLLLCVFLPSLYAWGDSDKVKLTDVKVLTLVNGKMTTARRSYPVPQLKCVGGSAGCGSFSPQVVQCTNQGSDGYDVQWECKTDMDNDYRFGKIEVFCEGYDYPDDPYILKGSCGLEYTLDLTKEGMKHKNGNYPNDYSSKSKTSSTVGTLIIIGIVALIAYAFYQTCLSARQYQYSSTDDGSSPGHQGGHFGFGSSGPSPPGFRPEFMGDNSNPGCGNTRYAGSQGASAGGFWTGAATGGILGYLFGRNTGYTNQYHQPYYQRPSAPSWGGGWGNSSSSYSGGGGSSGTREASGFGGTRRR